MSSFDSTASRFLRPSDVARLRRNQRQIQAHRLLVLGRNAGLVLLLAGAAFWGFRHTQSDERFAVRAVAVEGAVHTPRAALDRLTAGYVGLNLFRIDIARVQNDLGTIGWVERIDIEKTLPDTLRIRITERVPIALVRSGDALHYVDRTGRPFAELSTAVRDRDLPIISDAEGTELARTVTLIETLGKSDAELLARVSEIWPIAPRGFAIYDRELRAVVYANADDIVAKWPKLYAILAAENHPKIHYADLRFADRVIVKRVEVIPSPATQLVADALTANPEDSRRGHVQN